MPVLSEIQRRLLLVYLRRLAGHGLSAMVRVRDEEEFLDASVRSILDLVDEVVLVDNLSADRTPAIIEALRRAHPRKVRAFRYPYEVRRVGRETWDLASDPVAAASPHLSANYYNWCLKRCTKPYILKWDADMIALPALASALAQWRASGKPVLLFNGANVHPDRRHLAAAKIRDRKQLLGRLSVPGLPRWVTALTYDFVEPRLFPRWLARYDTERLWTQRLAGPFGGDLDPRTRHRAPGPCFLHLKFCKRDPWANYSPDLAEVIAGNVTVGPSLDEEAREAMRRAGLGPADAGLGPGDARVDPVDASDGRLAEGASHRPAPAPEGR